MRHGYARPYILAVVTLALVGAIQFAAGCGTKRGPQYRPDGSLEIPFWHGMSGKLGDVMDEMIAEFNAERKSRIFVNAQFMGEYNILNQKLIAAVAADMPPVIAQVFESWTDMLVRENIVARLDPLIDGPQGFERADVPPALLENVTLDGKIWSLPCNKSVQAIYWNKRLFEKAGLDPERGPATWDEFVEFARKLTVDENGDGTPDQYGFGLSSDVWLFINLLHCFGGEVVTPDGKAALVNSEAGVRAAAFMKKLETDGIAMRCTGREVQNKFASEDVAMFIGTVVSKTFIEGKLKFPLGMAHIPRGERAVSVMSGTNVLIFDRGSSAEVAAAFEFVKWFTEPEQTLRWSEGTTYLPVRVSAIESERAKELVAQDANKRVSLVPPEKLEFEPRSQEWFECRTLLAMAIERVIVGNADPKATLDEIVLRMNGILTHAEYR